MHPSTGLGGKRARVGAAVLVGAWLALAPSSARAQDANAEELFRRAKALMTANKHAEACPMLEESYRLEKAMGTLLNLALCHEKIGKVASAWVEFRAVEQQARAASPPREDRAKLAREHARVQTVGHARDWLALSMLSDETQGAVRRFLDSRRAR